MESDQTEHHRHRRPRHHQDLFTILGDKLAWEKYSVFSHNRCRQEELEKFKAPGLVAQKKAYFEEYYTKFRAMKGLQAEQETTQTYSYQNGQEITTQEENGVDTEASEKERKPSNTSQEENGADVHRSKEENKPSNVYKIQILDNHTTGNINPGEEESYLNGNSGGASNEDEIGLCFSARIPIYSMEDGSSSCTPSVKSSHPSFTNPRVDSSCRTKSDCRRSKDVVKPYEKPKPSVCKEITSKADVSLVSGKRITTKTASNKRSDQAQSHRQHRLPGTSSVLTRSAQEDHLRSSKEMTAISHLRKFSVDNRSCDGFGQRSLGLSGHHSLPKSRESESQRPKVVLKNLTDQDKSNQNTGLERPISSVKGRRQKKSSSVFWLPAFHSAESSFEDELGIVIHYKQTYIIELNTEQFFVTGGHFHCSLLATSSEGHPGLDEIDAGIGPKSDSSKGTGSQRTSNLKPVHKIVTSQSVYLTRQKDSRQIDARMHGLLSHDNCVMFSVAWTNTMPSLTDRGCRFGFECLAGRGN
ncbi:hypothetical protein POTOM_045547 [Populus tomentosa]|uniref:Protein WVD2-like 7 n=1 Tax=Populus tomentosa TaxID=118781 RepID=A0A8X7YTT4_POPTO|nr:hypothetical protein POTOM_045547 [Populus tomentosa]